MSSSSRNKYDFFNARLILTPEVFMSMGAGIEGPGTVDFDILPRSLTVILLFTFGFQRFLTQEFRHNPYMIELISLEFLVQMRRHEVVYVTI